MVLTIGMPLLLASLGAEDHRNDSSSERNPPTRGAVTHTLTEHPWCSSDKSVLGRHGRF